MCRNSTAKSRRTISFIQPPSGQTGFAVLSQNLKTEPTTESVSYDIAKQSTRHTFEEQGNGGCAVIKPEAFDSAAAGFAREQHQANGLEGKHGLTVIDPVLGLRWQQIKPNLSSRHGKHLISTKF